MRYRPLGANGMVVSAVSLALPDSPSLPKSSDWEAVVYAALESGINTFEVIGRHPALAEGVARALETVERRLICVAWRLGWTAAGAGSVRDFSPDGLHRSVESILARTGLGYLDMALLDDPHAEELSPAALMKLKALREAGRIHMLGVAGLDDAMDAYIATGAFDVVCLNFNALSGWKERLRLKAAVERDLAIVGFNYYPEGLHPHAVAPAAKPSLWGGRKPGDHAPAGGYDFLEHTPGWTGEEICLAYALTEPALATVQVAADRPERIEALAQIAERDMPSGVAAQIEMARFSATNAAGGQRRA
jgi:aryl-alcohol dehydrogenase-like predicted oxidoreductase